MVKRRTTILGLGALATGSGAAFTSAAFASSTEPSADFRVVVDQQLVVAANDSSASNVTTESEDSDASNPSDYLFGGPGDVINTDNINFGDVRSNGEAAVNDGTNDDLEVAVAVTSDEYGSFDPILQVENQGDTAAEVGITIAEYGDDVSSDGDADGQPIAESEVDDAFTFKIDGEDVGSSSFETVGAVETGDISIDLDLDYITDSDLRSAADPADPGAPDHGDVFGDGAAVDTVDLVDAIEVGVEDTST